LPKPSAEAIFGLKHKGLNVCFPYVPLMLSMSNKKQCRKGFFPAGKTKKQAQYKEKWTLWIIALFVFMLFAMVTVRAVYSADNTSQRTEITIGLRPSNIVDYSLGPGEDFNVTVVALNVSSLHKFQLTLRFDAAVINCSSIQEGDLLKTNGTTTVENRTIDNVGGSAYFSLSLNSTNEANGNGSLAIMEFHVRNRGETSLRLQEVNLTDANGTSILSYVTYDGYFNNKFLIDVAMPLALLSVTMASMFLNQRAENKLKVTLEDKELKTKDVVILVILMVVMISSIVFFRGLVAPLMVLFLFSYSMLLFIFTYLFSKRHWYIAAVPPAVFVLLYLFLRDTSIWSNYLISIYGVVFAILITLYVGSLFSWKPTLIFAALLTTVDIILVLVTGTMVQAANTTFKSLSLPVMVAVPIVPPIGIVGGLLSMALGIGDFFFAGLLAIQTFKKLGRNTAIISVFAMTTSFFVFETLLLDFWRIAFPGTLMIICGWLPVIAGKLVKDRDSKA